MFWRCGKSNTAIVPHTHSESLQLYYSNILEKEGQHTENSTEVDKESIQKKYGINMKRYNTIMRTRGMNLELMESLHDNGWNFNDTTQDIFLMALLNNPPNSINDSTIKA